VRAALSFAVLVLLPAVAAAQQSVIVKPYDKHFTALDAFIARQVEQHRLPALSIAVVDGDQVVWAKGYGFADPSKKTPATAQTVYRVGSVSKLFTDLAVMQLVEQKKLDLDSDVTKYLPDFKVKNDSGKAITLRQLMAHRSGLVREPPIGSYFDGEQPSLEKTVLSLNDTSLVYKPEEKMKYSNAGIAVVGRVLEKTRGKPFADCIRESLLEPMGMKSSSFEQTKEVKASLAKAIMWTYHGREFAAPTFDLGEAPAGNAYSTVLDLSRFMQVLFRKGQTEDGKSIVKAETLKQMYTRQFTKKDDKSREFGLGFHVRDFHDKLRVGHGGAVYGFATDLSVLPEEKLGVAIAASCDCANAVTSRIADLALEAMLAIKDKKPIPAIEETKPLTAKEVRELAGRYEDKDGGFDLIESAGRLYFLSKNGGFRLEVRRQGKDLITDDRLGHGLKIEQDGETLKVDKNSSKRRDPAKPAEIPAKWKGLLGEYGPDHIKLVILEKDGSLHALIEWVFLDKLEQESDNVFRFPTDRGLYPGEKLVFTRDKNGKATKVNAAGMLLDRRTISGEDGGTFTIKPQKPIEELRKLAEKAKPPEEREGLFRKPELVELVKLDDTIKLDIRYATKNNFLKTPFYRSAKAYLQKPAAEALVRVNKSLKKHGYGLMVFDGYRPWSVTKMFYDATPEDLRLFVADPSKGSRHNRGCAVDLTLYDLKTSKPIDMTGGYDEMSDRSYPDYLGGTSLQRWHRDLLRRAMEAEGFTVYEAEWWHFDYKDWTKYPIGNVAFEDLER
jgi:CubicO group peptidase (beta-lactamase class C family)/D-alanyl-D-alanine dipeptidase